MKNIFIIVMILGLSPFLWGSEKLNYMGKNELLQVVRAFQYQRGSFSDKEACSELGALIFRQNKAVPTIFRTLLEGKEVSVIEEEDDHNGKVLSVSSASFGDRWVGIKIRLKDFKIVHDWAAYKCMINGGFTTEALDNALSGYIPAFISKKEKKILWKVAHEFKRQQEMDEDVFEDEGIE